MRDMDLCGTLKKLFVKATTDKWWAMTGETRFNPIGWETRSEVIKNFIH